MHKFIIAFFMIAFMSGCATVPIVPKEEVGIKETMVKPLQSVTAITAGGGHTCALLIDGTIKCWGNNRIGQLGNDAIEETATPIEVVGITNIKASACGNFNTCFLFANGTIKCFGVDFTRSYSDIKAIDDKAMRKLLSRPVEIKEVSNIRAIATGWLHMCVILADGKVKCWGENYVGQLGNGMTTSSTTPVDVKGISDAIAITTNIAHTCVALSTGIVKCWGTDSISKGEINKEIYGFNSITPIEIKGISNAISVVSGRNHTCALLSDGTVKCWGSNVYGQLGSTKG